MRNEQGTGWMGGWVVGGRVCCACCVKFGALLSPNLQSTFELHLFVPVPGIKSFCANDLYISHPAGQSSNQLLLIDTCSSLCDVLTPQIIRDKVPKKNRCVRWSAQFLSVFQNARRSRARVGALAWSWVGVRVTVTVTVRVGRRPLAI